MLKNRSYKPELLDQENIPAEDLYQNLRELNFINTWLGGHDITVSGIEKLIKNKSKEVISIADIGCGGGDNLKAIALWARKKNIKVKLTGIDLKPECIAFAKDNCGNFPEIDFIISDYKLVQDHYDIIMSALFCHHLNDKEMIEYLKWSKDHAHSGFINDLERNIIAKQSISILTAFFSKSYLVKNDAPLSVARGFKRSELNYYFNEAGIKSFDIRWKWAFRYLIVYH